MAFKFNPFTKKLDYVGTSGSGGITSATTAVPYPASTFSPNGQGVITDSRTLAYIKDSNGNYFQSPFVNQVGSTIQIDLGTGTTPSAPIIIGFYN